LDGAQASIYDLIPDLRAAGVANESLATILAGIFGLLIVAGAATAVAFARRKREVIAQ
jgi:hypothetical protein